ncbi:MAG: DUF4917 family protein [Collimonas sp.]|uniref:DUF4917 family protein n=1 Tax=Collimonas sp. TaxID=1963772 RepID=UPI003263242B
MVEIVKWSDIAGNFTDGLILGNGASIAIHDGFSYKSLFAKAQELGFITECVAKVFQQFKVEDFEFVLRRLWYAKLVNEALEIKVGPVDAAYNEIRNALISTIRCTHVSYDEAAQHLPAIRSFLKNFKTVVTLNYDLTLYWAAMHGNANNEHAFKDCFHSGKFVDDWEEYRTPYGKEKAVTLYFYPHGNLVLTREDDLTESKCSAKSKGLLDAIIDTWEKGSVVPLFVCEGTSGHKRKAIESSSYLHRIYREIIPSLGKSLTIYGWGIGDQEKHILEQLENAKLDRVAVSVRDNNQEYVQHVLSKFVKIGIHNVTFFDSSSQGCWNNVDEIQ